MAIGKNIRRALLDGVQRDVTGINPNVRTADADRQAQRAQLAEFFRSIYSAGYDPMVVIEMCVAGAAFFGDNFGVSREQIATCVREVQISRERQLIYTPTDG